jgi:hypothetical protein
VEEYSVVFHGRSPCQRSLLVYAWPPPRKPAKEAKPRRVGRWFIERKPVWPLPTL